MQDRLTYANGKTITTEGFRCSIGEPIDIIVDEGAPFSYNAVIDTNKQMLVTLEVDGAVVCYRELHDIEIVNDDEFAIIVGDYTINIDTNELTGEYTSARIRLEPVELTVSDAFRAAVVKVAPKSEGGSGGGVLVATADPETGVLNKTWQEIYDGGFGVVAVDGMIGKLYYPIIKVEQAFSQYNVVVMIEGETSFDTITLIASSASDYPAFVE